MPSQERDGKSILLLETTCFYFFWKACSLVCLFIIFASTWLLFLWGLTHLCDPHAFVKQYECLVEGCGLKFKSYKSRQQHLVDRHKFSSSFEFFKKARPSKKQRQKHQRRQAIHNEDASRMMEVENAAIDDITSAVSKLSTSDSTPSSISFGRRNTRGLTFVPRAVQRESGSNSASPRTKRW